MVICEEINFELLPGGSEKTLFKNIIKNNQITNYKVTVNAGSEKGDNYMGIINKIVIEGKHEKTKENIQLNLILKSSPRIEQFRQIFNTDKLFGREILVYKSILPIFKQFQLSKGVKNIFKSYPELIDSSTEPFDEFLLMEDVKAKGFVMKDRKQTLDFNHCKLVMSELGKYHSISYAFKKHEPDVFTKYAYDHVMKDLPNANDFVKHQENMIVRALESLDPVKDVEKIDKLKQFITHIDECMEPLLKENFMEKHGVISHGDCWANNILFKYGNPDTPDAPTEVCFLDWQVSCLISPATDLSYFIYNCMSGDALENQFDEIIQIYYDSLARSLKEMDCNADELFPFAVLQDHMQKYFKFGFSMACTLIPLFTSEQNEVPDLTQMKDLSEEEMSKWNVQSKNIDLYNTRISAVINHAVKRGYL